MGRTTFSGPVKSDNGFEGALTLADPLSVGTVKAADGTTAFTIANSTGVTTFAANVTLSTKNIITDTTTGTKIGTATSQKLGFFNATPVVQQATTGTTTGFTAGAGTAVLSDSTFTGGTGSAAYTIGDVVKALKNLGLLAS
jgi:hypothetical protein